MPNRANFDNTAPTDAPGSADAVIQQVAALVQQADQIGAAAAAAFKWIFAWRDAADQLALFAPKATAAAQHYVSDISNVVTAGGNALTAKQKQDIWAKNLIAAPESTSVASYAGKVTSTNVNLKSWILSIYGPKYDALKLAIKNAHNYDSVTPAQAAGAVRSVQAFVDSANNTLTQISDLQQKAVDALFVMADAVYDHIVPSLKKAFQATQDAGAGSGAPPVAPEDSPLVGALYAVSKARKAHKLAPLAAIVDAAVASVSANLQKNVELSDKEDTFLGIVADGTYGTAPIKPGAADWLYAMYFASMPFGIGLILRSQFDNIIANINAGQPVGQTAAQAAAESDAAIAQRGGTVSPPTFRYVPFAPTGHVATQITPAGFDISVPTPRPQDVQPTARERLQAQLDEANSIAAQRAQAATDAAVAATAQAAADSQALAIAQQQAQDDKSAAQQQALADAQAAAAKSAKDAATAQALLQAAQAAAAKVQADAQALLAQAQDALANADAKSGGNLWIWLLLAAAAALLLFAKSDK